MRERLDLDHLHRLALKACEATPVDPAYIAFRYEMTPVACLTLLRHLGNQNDTLNAQARRIAELERRLAALTTAHAEMETTA
jgi:hypothetical protein